MAYKIQHAYKLDDIIEHVIYEKNVGVYRLVSSSRPTDGLTA